MSKPKTKKKERRVRSDGVAQRYSVNKEEPSTQTASSKAHADRLHLVSATPTAEEAPADPKAVKEAEEWISRRRATAFRGAHYPQRFTYIEKAEPATLRLYSHGSIRFVRYRNGLDAAVAAELYDGVTFPPPFPPSAQ